MRIFAVLRSFWKSSLDAELEYRSNFFLAALASLGNIGGSIFSLTLFYRGGGGFPDWTIDQSLVVLGLFTAFSGVVATILSPNLSRIVQHVEQGTLDFILLKPIDAQLQVSVRVLSPWGVPDLLFGAVITAVGAWRSDASASDVALTLVPICAGAVILYGLWFLVASTSIWFTKIYNATEVLRGLLDAGRFPLAAYPAAYRFVFTFVVPIAFLTTVPAEALLGRARPTFFLGGLVLALVLFVAARAFWRFSLKSYTGASG
ncbi:MAG TPA: ABC-2 family transporter protein [Myxococcota bacterium]